MPSPVSYSISAWARAKVGAIAAVILLANAAGISSQTKPLVIATEDDAAPWSRADGTGYANDLVVAAFKEVGVEIELRVVPYARCKRMVINGDAVACLSMSPSPEFEGKVELSAQPLFTCSAGYFYNVNSPARVRRQEDLPAKTSIGTVIGYEYPPAVEALRRKGIIALDESPSEIVNLKKLALGRVDLALLTYNELKSPEWLIARAGVQGKVKTSFSAGVLNSYIGFSRKHPQGAWAVQQFNEGHRRIMTNGALQRVRKTWLQKLESEKTLSLR